VKSRIYIIVPTLNACSDWVRFAPALLANISPGQVLVIDSSSNDGTQELAQAAGFAVRTIPRPEFNHGGTRQLGIELLSDADIVVFLTQDAILADSEAIDRLTSAFDDLSIGAAYGRQLPRPEAGPIEVHARLFNYGERSDVRTIEDRERLGFKSIFISNSFAAYRRSALLAVGGFPSDVIFGEDTVVAARLLLADWKIAYVGEARVYHSHPHSVMQEFQRYFDIGVLHAREAWLKEKFGSTGSEGMRFVRSELEYLWRVDRWLIPLALLRTASKWLGYRLGMKEADLNVRWKQRLSMHSRFWSEADR
jgi:rhamnosyltransferase